MSTEPTRSTAGWKPAFLGQVAECILGGTPSTEVPQYWGGDVPWMASGDVHLRRIQDVPGRITVRGLRSSNATLTSPPAVAMGLAGQGKTRGTVALTLCTLSTNQSIALLKANGRDLRTDFLFHNLDRRYEELRARSSGGGRGGLSKGILEAVSIELPPLGEQQWIAQILDTIDTAIHETEAIIAKLRAVKQGLLYDLLTRGIDASGELRPPQAEAPHLYKESPLGWIPNDWDATDLGSVCTWASGGTPNRAIAENWIGNVPLLTPKDMKAFELSNTSEHVSPEAAKSGSRLMPSGTVFIVVRGMILAHSFPVVLATRPMAFNQDIKAVSPGSKLNCRFLAHWFVANSNQFLRKVTEATHGTKKLDMENLLGMPIGLPSLAEQEGIVIRQTAVDERYEAEALSMAKLQAKKSGLMDDLLTGRVRVTPLINSNGRQDG